MIGSVLNIQFDKGFLFIRVERSEAVPVDFFAHRTAFRGFTIHEIQPGQLVEFTATRTEKGYRAEEVRMTVMPAYEDKWAERNELEFESLDAQQA